MRLFIMYIEYFIKIFFFIKLPTMKKSYNNNYMMMTM